MAPSFTLSPSSGTKTVYFKVQNGSGDSPVVSDTILALAPSVTTFDINSGGVSTKNPVVKLNNVATNSPTHYMASEDPGFVGATWQTYSTAPSFTLSSSFGTKTLYFKVKNSVDESPVVTDDILVDGFAPVITSFKINSGAWSTANPVVKLNNVATNSPTHYMASEDSGFVGATWQTYSTAPSFALGSGRGIKKVYFKVKNIFGESGVWVDEILTLAPVVTSFKINSGAVSTTNPVVTLTNVATNLPTQYMASEDAGFAGATWQTYSTAPSFTLSLGSGEKKVYFKVKNSVDESIEVSDTINKI
jgi:hypothetical protein